MKQHIYRVSSVCWMLATLSVVTSITSRSTEIFEEQRSIETCIQFNRKPEAVLDNENGLRCVVDTNTDPKLDNKRLMMYYYDLYTTYGGVSGYDSKFCYASDEDLLESVDVKISNDILDAVARYELTTCREDGHWTNGKILCEPQECREFTHQPKDLDYLRQQLAITVNMRDLDQLTNDTLFIRFSGTPDPRLVYNIQTNTTTYYTTQQFLDLCESDGPCFKGKFVGNDNLLYSFMGRPPLAMKKMGNKVFIGIRYDPRPFVFPESMAPRRCRFEDGKSQDECDSPAGVQSWKILWESSLPFSQEWVDLYFDIKWSYKHDCKIVIWIGDQKFEFREPCGRYSDMKLGNYPYPKFGLFNGRGSGVGNRQIRFRDIVFRSKTDCK